MNRNLRFFSIVLALGGVSAVSIAWDFWPKPKDNASINRTNEATIQVDDGNLNRHQRFVTSYAPIVKKVSQSVVSIFTTTTIREVEQISPFNDPLFQQFFGRSPFGPVQPRERIRKEQNLGSGVIISKEGYIITNNHVVDKADEVKVSLSTGKKEYQAKLVGKDPKTDIAVLKIEAADLQPLLLGNSEKIEVGDIVLAIGNPFGIGQTVTMGIISALGRNALDIETYEDFIQTDAAINPGNSGGALVDAEGRLIGINTAILSRSGGNQGIGFAVPVNLARDIMERLLKDGRVIRGFLGVNIQDINSNLAQVLNLSSEEGAIITEVVPQSPAERAGLKEKDVIFKVDGKPIHNSEKLRFIIGQKSPDVKIILSIFREGKEQKVEVMLQETEEKTLEANSKNRIQGKNFLEGVVIGDLNNDLRRQLQAPMNLQGAIVMSIDENAIAAQEGEGLQRGDVIVEFDRQPVRNADDLIKLSEKLDEKLVLLRVWRRGMSLFITINLER